MQFRQWCYRQVDRYVAKLTRTHKQVRRGGKEIRYERDGDICRIPLTDSKGQRHVWIIPATFLESAQKLWPVSIRFFESTGKPYVSRKKPIYAADSTRYEHVALHKLFLSIEYRLDANEITSTPRNGDFLDWRDGNLQVSAVAGRKLPANIRELRLRQSIRESSQKQVQTGAGTYSTVSISKDDIPTSLIEEWEKLLADDDTSREFMDFRKRGWVDNLSDLCDKTNSHVHPPAQSTSVKRNFD
jgi:hypothetical protein